jgi:murein L,D-transpeptidase YcbB/YkuD
VKIEPPVNVYWVYITAWGTPEGVVQFREDLYKRDGFSTAAGGAPTIQPVAQQSGRGIPADAAPDEQ